MIRGEFERVLEDIAAAQSADGPPIERTADGTGQAWSRGATVFARLGDAGIELRLDRGVAAAAVRTPDTAPSGRGPEWVRFNPRILDPHAVDRLDAWFGLAARRAAGAPDDGGVPPS